MAGDYGAGPIADFCAALKRLLMASGRTQREVARELHISRSRLSEILKGKLERPPDWETRVRPFVLACTGGDEHALSRWRRDHDTLTRICEALECRRRASAASQPRGSQAPGSATGPGRPVHMLRADTAAFTGRKEEIDEICRALSAGDRPVGIRAIDGMPGVGKTALAVHVGHLLADRFPDGQIFVDLYGYSDDHSAAEPGDALATLLRYLDVPPDLMPQTLEERASLWRDQTDGRKLLLILDNAARSEQVIPLIPGSGECLVLVTSRRELSRLARDYGARMLGLGLLPEQEAVALFHRLAGRLVDPADLQATASLVQSCGRLPLAIAILAGGLRPGVSAADLVTALEAARGHVLEIDAQFGEPEMGVAAAFDLSYRELSPGDQHMLRLLSVTPGAAIDALAAAALAGLPLRDARSCLGRLRAARMIEPAGHDRYRLHDLVAQYARLRGAPSELGPAFDRLMDYYQRAAEAADLHLTRFTRPGVIPPAGNADGIPRLHDRKEAQGWMTRERETLLACIDQANARHERSRVVGLTAAMAGYLRATGPWSKAADLHTTAAVAAADTADVAGQADALNDLGLACYMAEDYPAANAALEHALSLYRETGNRLGQANALNHLGAVRKLRADLPGAIDAHGMALGIYREIGDRLGEANALSQLGATSYMANDTDAAARGLREALAIYRGIGDEVGEANALIYLGAVQDVACDYRGALVTLRRALDIYRDSKNQIGTANVLNQLGATKQVTGDYSGATAALEEALVIYRDIKNRISEANALNRLGAVQGETGNYPLALATLEQALVIYRTTENELGQADVLSDLGNVHLSQGEFDQASAELQQALGMFRDDLDDELGQAQVLNRAGRVHLANAKPSEAEACHQRAMELALSLRNPMEEARAWEGLGRCGGAQGSEGASVAGLRRALDIYERIGSSDAARLRAELDTDR